MIAKKLVHEEQTRADTTFIRGGFSYWHTSTEKFRDHEKSSFHLEAMYKIAQKWYSEGAEYCQSGSAGSLQVSMLFGPDKAYLSESQSLRWSFLALHRGGNADPLVPLFTSVYCTACTERSFSALHHQKTWLCSTVTQCRLTDMALLHVHKDILDNLAI